MKKNYFLLILLALSIATCYAKIHVTFNQKYITYTGRIDTVGKQYTTIYWPGSSVSINFRGTEIKAILKNGKEDAYFYAILDGKDDSLIKIKADTIKSVITLASGLENKNHTLELFKLSNNTSYTDFYGFELPDKSRVLKSSPKPKRKIEFYGNSITAGHGVDLLPGNDDSGSPEFFNNYWTYAALTARHFNAQYSCIARSGIGIMVSWFPIIMPEMYNRLNPENPDSKWNFTKYIPDIVVINLFQNDMWLISNINHPQFKARFGTIPPDEATIIKLYQDFVKCIRSNYPNASIICALGSMNATETGSPWPGYVENAVKELGDSKIYTLFFPYKDTPGHPKKYEQRVMADKLIQFIDKNINW